MKTFLWSTVLLLTLTTLSRAQSLRAAGPNLAPQTPAPPPYCQPCLFYGGDFDPTNPNADGIESDKTLYWQLVPNSVYVPFVVPPGQQWTAGGVFLNVLSNNTVIDPAAATFSILTGVSFGNGGTSIATATSPATYIATGRTYNGYTEYTVQLKIRPVVLQPGTYWLTVEPWCTNPNDSQCAVGTYYASDVEDDPAPNHKGNEPWNDSFFSGSASQLYFVPTWGPNGVCDGLGCNRFSAGVIGTAQRILD